MAQPAHPNRDADAKFARVFSIYLHNLSSFYSQGRTLSQTRAQQNTCTAMAIMRSDVHAQPSSAASSTSSSSSSSRSPGTTAPPNPPPIPTPTNIMTSSTKKFTTSSTLTTPVTPALPPPTPALPPTTPAIPVMQKPLNRRDINDAVKKLAATPMFRQCHIDDLAAIAATMTKFTYLHNDYIVTQNQPAHQLLILASGEARRLRVGRDGVERFLHDDDHTIGSLTVTSGGPIYASAKCVSESCTAYALSRAAFRTYLATTPRFATTVIESLSNEVRQTSRRFRTPLLAQRSSTHDVNIAAVAVSATVESYYRSVLNAILNRQLSGDRTIQFFPNMQVQVPARVAYITGFKTLRTLFDRYVDPDQWTDQGRASAVRLATTLAPGILMTPIASLLEACNATTKETLLRRSSRGVLPRAGREIIFGVGLNQLSDFFEERFRQTFPTNPVAANMAGSVTAGVAAGYFSHIPHNLSVLRMLHPGRTYAQLFQSLVEKSVPAGLIPTHASRRMQTVMRTVWTCLLPKGVLTRTVQICGSFAILNSIIMLVEGDNRRRVRKVIDTMADRRAMDEDIPTVKGRQ